MSNNYKQTIKLLDGEYWWGGAVEDGVKMPYADKDFSRDLNPIATSNQAAPFLVSSKGRYVWCEEPFNITLENNVLTLISQDAPIQLIDGLDTLQNAYWDASSKHFPPTETIPEEMLFKYPQYNTWIELMYDQTEDNIRNYANKLVENGYPKGILMIDDNWQEDYGVWKFHEGRFQSPKKLIHELHSKGFKVMLWVCPFISPDCATFRYLEQKDYLVKDYNNEVAIRRWWNGYSAILDLSNPDATLWFKNQLDKLVDTYGIDGFKFDAGDPHYYLDNDTTATITSPLDQCKKYALLGLDYELNEYRASWNVAGKPLVQRLCDKDHAWGPNGLGSLIPNGLAQNLMGYYYNCPDMIGGGQYTNFLPDNLNLDEELVVRYAQCSALFPMMQFSVAPWRILSESNAQLCLDMAILHEKYGDYILELAKNSSKTGEPIITPLAYYYGNEYDTVNEQFMLGKDMLVAPVIKPNEYVKTVVFPKGRWQGDDGSIVEGPCNITVEAPITRLPYYKLID